MNKLRLIVVGASTVLVAGSGVLIACSEESLNLDDGGADSSVAPDVKPVPVQDASPEAEAAPPFDGGTVDFTGELATAMCKAVARCCWGDPDTKGDAAVDGGFYDQGACLSLYRKSGFENSLVGINEVDAGLLELDPQQAGNCLAHAEAISCNLSGSELAQLRTECFNAFYSKAPAGSSCNNAASCGKGLFCNTAADGGAKCEPLRGDGGPCGDWTTDQTHVDEACTWRGMGGDQYCQIFTPETMATWPTGTAELDAGQYFCAPASATDGPCNSDRWCKAGVCSLDPDYKCQEPVVFFPPVPFCQLFTKKP